MDELRKYCEKGRDEMQKLLSRQANEGTIGEYSYGYVVGYRAALADVLRKIGEDHDHPFGDHDPLPAEWSTSEEEEKALISWAGELIPVETA